MLVPPTTAVLTAPVSAASAGVSLLGPTGPTSEVGPAPTDAAPHVVKP